MSRTVTIEFPADQDEHFSLVHRLQNFGEDVFRFVREYQLGTVLLQEIDRSTASFAIREVKASKGRRVVSWVEKESSRQHLRVNVSVS